MKTTLELPDALLAEAKLMALRRRTTLKALFTKALERELHGAAGEPTQRFSMDEHGWPLLQRDEHDQTTVTEQFLKDLRESEGV